MTTKSVCSALPPRPGEGADLLVQEAMVPTKKAQKVVLASVSVARSAV